MGLTHSRSQHINSPTGCECMRHRSKIAQMDQTGDITNTNVRVQTWNGTEDGDLQKQTQRKKERKKKRRKILREKRERKERESILGSPSPSPSVSLCLPHQLSVLGSLSHQCNEGKINSER